MKKILFILFCTSNLMGQNLKVLDEKNGFRNIKLGSSITQYSFFEKATTLNKEYRIIKKILDSEIINYLGKLNSTSDCLSNNCKEFIIIENPSIYADLAHSKILKIGVSTFKDKIYEINLIIEANAGRFSTFIDFVNVFGYPNGINFNWDISEFDKAEKNDDPLYMSWHTNNVIMSIISINANEKFRGTKRIGYKISYTDMKIEKLINEENKKTKTKNNPADQF